MDYDKEGHTNVYDKIMMLLAEAASCPDDRKAGLIREAQGAILHDQRALLDGFLDEMLSLLGDSSAPVRIVTVQFLEEASRADQLVIPKVAEAFIILFKDETQQAVLCQLAQSAIGLFECAVAFLSNPGNDDQSAEQSETLKYTLAFRDSLIASLNRADCKMSVRFRVIGALERLAVYLLPAEQNSSANSKSKLVEKSLDAADKKPDIDRGFLKRETRELEAHRTLDGLVNAARAAIAKGDASIASLFTAIIRSCINVAVLRPVVAQRAIEAMALFREVETSGRLSTTQRNSLRKDVRIGWVHFIKQNLANIGSTSTSHEVFESVSSVLLECGMSQSEVSRHLPPSLFETSKPATTTSGADQSGVEMDVDANGGAGRRKQAPKRAAPQTENASTAKRSKQITSNDVQSLETIANDLARKLTPINVTDLVLLSMVCLPDSVPDSFRATYKPIVQAGSSQQIRSLALLLAPQVSQLTVAPAASSSVDNNSTAKQSAHNTAHEAPIPMQVTDGNVETSDGKGSANVNKVRASPQKARSAFSLAGATKRLDAAQTSRLVERCYASVCALERVTSSSSWLRERNKILVSLALLDNTAGDGGELMDYLERYIIESLARVERRELAALWLYAEYAYCQLFDVPLFSSSAIGIHSIIDELHPRSMERYDCVLTRLLLTAMNHQDKTQQTQLEGEASNNPAVKNGVQSQKSATSSAADTLFVQLLIDAPYVTPNAIELLKQFCTRSSRVDLGINTLRRLIAARRSNENLTRDLMTALLSLVSVEDAIVQQAAVRACTEVYNESIFATEIHEHAVSLVRNVGELSASDEDRMRSHVRLFIALMTNDTTGELLLELADLYADASTEAKRFLLRAIEQPIRQLAALAGGAAILKLVDAFDTRKKAADTLLLRVLHILTERQTPSRELVRRVEALFKRSGNVRLLLPVLHGLAKADFFAALPKLVTLDEKLLKDSLTRVLLGTTASGSAVEGVYTPPVTISEFFVALHNLEFSRAADTAGSSGGASGVPMNVILRTLNLFLSDARLYTPDVATQTLTQLVEQTPIPTTFMRTVLQTQSSQPRLSSLVIGLLTRLVQKAIWKHDDLWKGFVLACQRTFPACASVLFQLPLAQLQNVFERAADLRERLLKYVRSLPPHAAMNVPTAVLQALQLLADKPQVLAAAPAIIPTPSGPLVSASGAAGSELKQPVMLNPTQVSGAETVGLTTALQQPNGTNADHFMRASANSSTATEVALIAESEAADTNVSNSTRVTNNPQVTTNVSVASNPPASSLPTPAVVTAESVPLQPQTQPPAQQQMQTRAGLRSGAGTRLAQTQRKQLADADKQKLLKMKKIDFLATATASAEPQVTANSADTDAVGGKATESSESQNAS